MSDELEPCPFCGNKPAPYWNGVGCVTSGCLLNGLHLDADKWNRRAQPAEAEGSELPGMWQESDLSGGKADCEDGMRELRRYTPISQGDHIPAMNPCDHGGWVRHADHLAALSAVTAERDRLLQGKGDPAGSFEKCMQAMRDRDEHAKTIDQLRAEVEELREDAERWRYVSLQGDDTHWLNLLRVDLEDFGGNINAAVDALIDGEAPAMAAKEA
ncbi:hypothetical protein [Stutzerimonas nitrititolerans]|uniref:hypothetical protein n=1 Tax=Stutzerimonas nitrititolerans TaxID=2482751 RepID=UPI00289632E6|nr:hypothetical protein [Stutzerimonas nitrititolerans]